MEFYQTKLGQKFYEKDLPSLIVSTVLVFEK